MIDLGYCCQLPWSIVCLLLSLFHSWLWITPPESKEELEGDKTAVEAIQLEETKVPMSLQIQT